MTKYQGRHKDLRNRLNNHLKKLTGLDKDFYETLSQDDLLELKSAVVDINNVLTLKMTDAATKWLCKFFHLNEISYKNLLVKVDVTKPNSNGFDIQLDDEKKIIAEVKCIVPINNGEKYGAAQWNSILDDAIKLQNGKRSLPFINF